MKIYNIINIPKGLLPDAECECDCQVEYNSGYTAGYNAGEEDQKSKLSYVIITENGEYTAEDGFSAVTVNVSSSSGASYDEGFEDGYESGTTDGFNTGYPSGYTDGYGSGYTDGAESVDCSDFYNSGYTDGYESGTTVGFNEGYDSGRTDGWNQGYPSGYTDGHESGVTEGWDQGYDSGYTDGVESVICEDCSTYFDSGYTSGHTDGYGEGYDSGRTDGYADGWQPGYNSGYTDGVEAAGGDYASGYTDGFNIGYPSGYTDGFNQGYDSGSTDGYNSGMTVGYNSGYTDGYGSGSTDGYSSGYTNGYDSGTTDGYNSGITVGYDSGYTDGYESGSTNGYGSGYTNGYNSGRTDGFDEGYTSGNTDGYNTGKEDGYDSGVTAGYASGYTSGYTDGYDSGYTDGAASVDCTDFFNSGYTSGYTDGETSGYADGIAHQKSLLSNLTASGNGRYELADGWSAVTVNVPSDINNQSLAETLTRSDFDVVPGYVVGGQGEYYLVKQTLYRPESGYTGLDDLSQEIIISIDEFFASGATEQRQKLSADTFTQNGTYTRADGWSSITVNVAQTGYTQQDLENAYASGLTVGYNSGWTGGYDSGYTDGLNDCECPGIKGVAKYNVISTSVPTQIICATTSIDTATYNGNDILVDTGFTFPATGIQTINYTFKNNTIGQKAFANVPALVSFEVPEGITTLEKHTFCYNDNLEEVKLPTTLTGTLNCFAFNPKLSAITIPEGVVAIGNGCFESCATLEHLTIPDSVSAMNRYSIYECPELVDVHFGTGISYIRDTVCYHTDAITGITIDAVVPPALENNYTKIFTGNYPIYVPAASVEAYKTAWPDYASRIEAIQN